MSQNMIDLDKYSLPKIAYYKYKSVFINKIPILLTNEGKLFLKS